MKTMWLHLSLHLGTLNFAEFCFAYNLCVQLKIIIFVTSRRLVVALSRDLEEEFYPYFQNFFKIIVKVVMKSKTTNIIESGFKCYAYLSKYLRRQIIRDLRTHLKQFACFLDPKLKAYVMIFACEAFSIVSGKYARDHPQQFLKLLFEVFLRNNPEVSLNVFTIDHNWHY